MSKSPMVVKTKTFKASDKNAVSDCLTYIGEELGRLKISKKLAMRAELISEEMISEFVKHADENGSFQVKVKHIIGDTSISIKCNGAEFDPYGQLGLGLDLAGDDVPETDSQQAIRSILLKSMGDKLKYSHKNGVNSARIIVGQAERSALVTTLVALGLGIVCGLLMKYVLPANITAGVTNYALDPVKTMFMNSLKIIIGPVIFFSIVSCVSQFKDLTELGKIGAKVIGTYLFTTIIAVTLGFTMALVFKPGEVGFALDMAVDEVTVVSETGNTSLVSTIVNIVPTNLLAPFISGDTLQIIFLAVLIGIAVGKVGEYSKPLKDLFEAANSLFLAITTLITKFTPVAIFASLALLFSQMEGTAILSLFKFLLVLLSTMLLMMTFYGLLVFVVGRLNPFRFFKNAREGMLTSFTLLSSSAAMPTNLKVCTNKMGVSPKVANLSIPLGATINMDGACIFMAVGSIFLSRAYGMELPLTTLLSISITIMLLSLSSPGVPCAGIVSLGVVLATLGIPVEALAIILGIFPIIDMFVTTNNTTGDVATAVLVAKTEKLLDTDIFYGKK